MRFLLILTLLCSFAPAIIIRHDKSDQDYQELAKQFENVICHLNLGKKAPDGEGTIIHPSWVLTAAHCAFDIKRKLDSSKEHFVTILDEKFKVDKVIIHESWMENEAFDIALVHLEKPTTKGKSVELFTGNDELNKLVYMVGLGDFGDGVKGITGNDGKLRAATNKVDEATNFWLKWSFDNVETNPDKGTEYEGISGPGDSGGPAFIKIQDKLFLAGISSGQSSRNTNGRKGVYGVIEYYTRVSRYIEWINKSMR